MLQKIVKDKYTPDHDEIKPKSYKHHEQFESILLEKDLQINELLEKIALLSESLAKKT